MASQAATRPQVASPSIFGQTDDLSKIYAQQMLTNPAMGGTAGALLMGQEGVRAGQIQDYYNQVREANRLQMLLSQQQDEADLLKEALQQGHHYITAGANVADMPLISRLFTRGATDPQTVDASTLVNSLKKAQIAHYYAQVAASNAAGEPQTTVQTGLGPDGKPVTQIVTTKGRGTNILDANTQAVRSNMVGNYGQRPGPFVYQQPTTVQNRQYQLQSGEGGTLSIVPR